MKRYNEFKRKIHEWYEGLNGEQQFLLFGLILPFIPIAFVWVFCIFFRAYSWLRLAGDVLLCCYSVVCSTFSIYYGIKKDIFLLKNVGYSILVMFIATVNVFISNYKDVGGSRANVFIALSVLIVIYATFKSFSNVLKLIVMGWWS